MFAFLFWGVLALAFAVIWLGTLVVMLLSRLSRSRFWRLVVFLPFAGTTSCAIWFASVMYFASTPNGVFTDSFGFTPTADVRALKSQSSCFGDYCSIYLKFQAKPQTIQRIASLGLNEVAEFQANRFFRSGSNVPAWWAPGLSTANIIYAKKNRQQNFATEDEILYYDKRTEQAYYSFVGID